MKTEFLMRTHPGQTDLEQKSPAEERESYIDTMSEETAIKQKNSIKWRKPQVFNPDFLHKDKKHGRSRDFSLLLPFFVWLCLNATAPYPYSTVLYFIFLPTRPARE